MNKSSYRFGLVLAFAVLVMGSTPLHAQSKKEAAVSAPATASASDCIQNIVHAHVEGMTCAVCAASVTKALKADKAVDEVQVDVAKGIVTIAPKDGKTITDEVIAKAVDHAGFKVTGVDHAVCTQ